MDDDFYLAYHWPNPTVFEDYGPAKIETGLLDARGDTIYKKNPQAKEPVGFRIPSITSGVKRV